MIDVTPEPTPNPNAFKFTLGRPSTAKRSETFRQGSDPAESPLGARIFSICGVTNVFMAGNFVSVTKRDDVGWDELGPDVVEAIRAHFAEREPG